MPFGVTFSPLFIGAMVATESDDPDHWQRQLSVPFSSGQWLLLKFLHHNRNFGETFSPLFIGAMVATLDGSILELPNRPFSPLFIGAMVATRFAVLFRKIAEHFQSPFHRGNGCYGQ